MILECSLSDRSIRIPNLRTKRAEGPRVLEILGIRISDLTAEEIASHLQGYVHEGTTHMIFTPNVDDIVKAQRDDKFRALLNSAAINLPDGMGVVYASRLLGKGFREMIGGRRLVPKICQWAQGRGWRIFLFGAKERIAESAKRNLLALYPRTSIVGAHSPSMQILEDENESRQVIGMINDSEPDFLFVGLGSPKGKLWISKHVDDIKVPVIIEVGGSFDVLAGVRRVPPSWMTNTGLEWLYRLIEQPRYVWRRYLLDDPRFFWWIFIEKIKAIR